MSSGGLKRTTMQQWMDANAPGTTPLIEPATGRWTPEEDARFIELVRQGKKPKAIGLLMGRSREAVVARGKRLDIYRANR